jgi:hypothetical protein
MQNRAERAGFGEIRSTKMKTSKNAQRPENRRNRGWTNTVNPCSHEYQSPDHIACNNHQRRLHILLISGAPSGHRADQSPSRYTPAR